MLLTCAAIGISGLLTALAALISSARSRNRAAGDEFAELKGRLSAIAELSVQQSAEQARGMNERIDSLARNLSQALDATAARLGENLNVTAVRLGDNLNATASRLGESINSTAARLGDNLSESERRTWESLSTLNERLALIDEANRSLTELSTEVGSLHGVLANKQARGAFGQMRMETIVRAYAAFQKALRAANAQLRSTQAQLTSAANSIFTSLKEKFTLWQNAADRVRLQAQLLEAAVVRMEIARVKYSNGLMTFQDWDYIENELITNQKSMLSTQRNAIITRAEWEKAVGLSVIP